MKLPNLPIWAWVAIAGGAVVLFGGAMGATPIADSAKIPKVNERKRENARIIERAVRAAGFDDRVVKAAIANAWRESGLNELAIGDGGQAVGLFQVHPWGGDKAYRSDPSNNVQLMLDKEARSQSGFGRKFRAVVDGGGSAEDVADAWCRYLERPADKDGEGAKSRAFVRQFWGA
jgi:hypothetical protein